MNRRIQKYQQIARYLLGATQKQLDYGLSLHQESIVCDAYGFAPHSPVDAGQLRKLLTAGCSPQEYKDAVEEMVMTGHLSETALDKEFRQAWQASGVTCIVQNAGEETQFPLQILKRLARYTLICDLSRDFLVKVAHPEDILLAKKKAKHSLCFTCNAIPLAQSWVSVEEELSYVAIFFQLGCRMMHLTYNRRNMFGDGCGEENDGGLSDFGKEAIKQLNRTGIIVDVAHSGWKTSLQAARFSSKPVVASHSGAWSVNQHIRNKPDEVIKAIADSGGYLGVCAIPYFLGGKGNICSLLDHVDYIVRKFGADYVAIGTDRAYECFSKQKKTKIRQMHRRPSFQSLWPEGSLPKVKDPGWDTEEQLGSLDWVCWPFFTVGLVQRGYSDQDIQKIIGLNVLRVLKANFPAEKYLRLK